jgi:hypothetical protein
VRGLQRARHDPVRRAWLRDVRGDEELARGIPETRGAGRGVLKALALIGNLIVWTALAPVFVIVFLLEFAWDFASGKLLDEEWRKL